MKHNLAKFYKSEFASNAINLSLGTIVAQVVPILFYPIFSRIFEPKDFGFAANFSVIIPILVILATGMYESGILISDTKKEALNLVGLILLRSSIILLGSEIVIIIFGDKICNILNQKELKSWLFLIPIASFATIVTNIYSEWSIKNKAFSSLSKVRILNTTSVSVSKLLFGVVKFFGNGLILGDVFGRLITAIICTINAFKQEKELLQSISIKRFKYLSKKYKDLPKFTMPDQLISNIGGSAPTILIGMYFSNTELGYFSVAGTLLTVPITVFTISIRDVFRQKVNEEFSKTGNCQKIYIRLLKLVSIFGIIGFLILYLVIPYLIDFVLGKDWATVSSYAQIQMPMFFLSFISMSLSGVLIIAKKMKISFYWQIYYTIVTISSMLVGIIYFNTIEATLILLVISRCSAYLLYMILSYIYSKGIKN